MRPNPDTAHQFNGRYTSPPNRERPGSRVTMKDRQRMRSLSPNGPKSRDGSSSLHTAGSHVSLVPPALLEDETDIDEADAQDIEELW